MSIPVTIAQLPDAINTQIGWCYLLSVSEQGHPRVVATTTTWSADGLSLNVHVGQGTAANIGARPAVTLVWAPLDPSGMSLIVDGVGVVKDLAVTIQPTSGVMHRSAIAQ